MIKIKEINSLTIKEAIEIIHPIARKLDNLRNRRYAEKNRDKIHIIQKRYRLKQKLRRQNEKN